MATKPIPAKAGKVLSGVDGVRSTGNIIAELIQLKQHEYGRGYLTAVSDLLPIVESEASPEAMARILERFQVIVDQERTPKVGAQR